MSKFLTNWVDATSRPLVGFAAIITEGFLLNSLATMSFCWFPPLKDLAGDLRDLTTISNLLINFLACSVTLLQSISLPGFRNSGYLCRPKNTFSRTLMVNTRPTFFLSSGICTKPLNDRVPGSAPVTSSPIRITLPLSMTLSPVSASTSSF